MTTPTHQPVMLEPLLAAFAPYFAQGYGWVDATLGLGGHTLAMLPHLHPDASLCLNDRDPHALAMAQERLLPHLSLQQQANTLWRNAPFGTLAELANDSPALLARPLCVLADLGVSSYQLDVAERGFSFRHDGPLDMRMEGSTSDRPTAADLVNTATQEELTHWFFTYGEETLARPMAKAIVTRRQNEAFTTTTQLATLLAKVSQHCRNTPRSQQRSHPATRVFQALRIVVNDELAELETLLADAPTWLPKGSILALLTFHSLEDRVVKQWGKQAEKGCVCPPRFPVCQCGIPPVVKALSRKPLLPSPEEVESNPRARSVKLRLYQKL